MPPKKVKAKVTKPTKSTKSAKTTKPITKSATKSATKPVTKPTSKSSKTRRSSSKTKPTNALVIAPTNTLTNAQKNVSTNVPVPPVPPVQFKVRYNRPGNRNNNSNNGNSGRGVNFNGILRNAVKAVPAFDSGKTVTGYKYSTEREYNNSFSEVIAFSSKYPNKKIFDYVLYHKNNIDGLFAAYIYWNYLTEGGTDKSFSHVIFKGVDVGDSRRNDIFREIQPIIGALNGKNVLLLDVAYNSTTLNAIKNAASTFVIIDDHHQSVSGIDGEFKSVNHCAAAATYKFFNPDKDVNMLIQQVDNNDMKLFLPYIHYNHEINMALSVRILKNFYNVNILRKNNHIIPVYNNMFEKIHKVFTNGDAKFLTLVGHYMSEYRENVKFEIANNARMAMWDNKYRVAALNFDSPSLTKVIGRQMLSNFKNRGEQVDFAVLWAYHYTRGYYNVQFIDDHQQTRYNMPNIAKEYDTTSDGGGGREHIGHFYTNKDIHKLLKFSGDRRE
jgi:hypothetical protein